MSEVRVILRMGMGVDPGHDPTVAATRAIGEALGRAVLPLLDERTPRVVVHVGVQHPDHVDVAALEALFDHPVALHVAFGGLDLTEPPSTVAQVAIEVFLPGAQA